MALLDRQPHVVRLGTNAQGVFSDVLDRQLPNDLALAFRTRFI
jgi:hypothetical protein